MTKKEMILDLIAIIEDKAEDAERVSEEFENDVQKRMGYNHGFWGGRMSGYRDVIRMLKKYQEEI